MPTLTFTFDTGTVPIKRVLDGICAEYGYQTTLPDGKPNPETEQQFARRMIGEVIKNTVIASERRSARAKAEAEVPPMPLT